jgi:hypothetical protein
MAFNHRVGRRPEGHLNRRLNQEAIKLLIHNVPMKRVRP